MRADSPQPERTEGRHVPVMLADVVDLLRLAPGATYVDCTAGSGGHAAAAAEVVGAAGGVVLIDRDREALLLASRALSGFAARVTAIHGSFADLASLLAESGVTAADAVLFDLGLSSLQLSDPKRGFSFQREGPLDMRMDPGAELSADEVVNTWPERELARIIEDYGGDPMARRIARAIVGRRIRGPIRTTAELAAVVSGAVKVRGRSRRHPATRTFQALRMAVNDEPAALGSALPQAFELLRPGGRLLTIAYHSGEDRICKVFGRLVAGRGPRGGGGRAEEAPAFLSGSGPWGRVLTGKGLTPAPAEVAANPRARSARLRAIEKLSSDEGRGSEAV